MARGQGIKIAIPIVILIAGIVGLNYMQHLNSPTEAEAEQQAQEAAAKAQQAAASKQPPPSPPPAAKPQTLNSHPAQTGGVTAPSDLVVSGSNGGHVVALAYTVNSQIFDDPSSLNEIAAKLQGWEQSHPNNTLKIVCLDLPKTQLSNPADHDLPLGLSVDGKSVGGCDTNPGAGIFSSPLLETVLKAVK